MFGMFPFNLGNAFNMLNGLTNIFSDAFFDTMSSQVLSSDTLNDFMEDIRNENSRFNIEMKEYDESYLIKGRLPGVDAKDIDVDFQENKIKLSIKNKRSYSNGSNIMVTVVNYGDSYVKEFYVDNVDYSRMKVSFKDSILFMSFPKVKRVKNDEMLDQDIIIDVKDYKVE